MEKYKEKIEKEAEKVMMNYLTFLGLAKATKRWLVCRVAFAKPVLCSRCGFFSSKLQSEQGFLFFFRVDKNIFGK